MKVISDLVSIATRALDSMAWFNKINRRSQKETSQCSFLRLHNRTNDMTIVFKCVLLSN